MVFMEMEDDGLTTEERLHRLVVMQVQTMLNHERAGQPVPRDAEGCVIPEVQFEDCTPEAFEIVEKIKSGY
jgi:hypothetical protein